MSVGGASMRIWGISIILILFIGQISLTFCQNAASTAFIEDPFNYQGEYKLDPNQLTIAEKTALPYVQEYSKSYGISPALIMAIINRESSYNSNDIGDSGLAIGYMQLHWDAAYDAGYRSSRGTSTDFTEEDWPTDGLDPNTNIRYGCEYLEICYSEYRNSDVYGDALKNTLSSYNRGRTQGPDLSNEDTYVNPIIDKYENYKYKIMYYVDMGNPVDESSHDLIGWGNAQVPPDNPYTSPSGDKTKRYQTLHGDNSLDFTLKRIGIPYVLSFEVEDGSCDDSFEVWIGDHNLGYFKGKNHGPDEAKGYEIEISKDFITDTKVTITFKNKASDNCGLAAVYNIKLVPQYNSAEAMSTTEANAPTTEDSESSTALESSFTVSATADWIDTGITVSKGDLIKFTAIGHATYGLEGSTGNYPTTNPDGDRFVDDNSIGEKIDPSAIDPSAPIGSLVGKIGLNGDCFYIGSSNQLIMPASGTIMLRYNDVEGEYYNNGGSYNVIISKEEQKQSSISRYIDVHEYSDKIGPGGDLSGVPPGMGGTGLD